MKKLLAILFITLSLAGCTKIKIVGANFPALFADQICVFDLVYGVQPWQKLDVYRPKIASANSPVIVFFYGGRWQFGSKGDYRFAADAFTKLGYVVVIADYVKYPEGKYPQFVEDGAAAVKWTHQNIAKYNGNPNRIFVMGHSAGAHLGAMLTANKKFGATQYIKAFVGLAGAYDFKPTELFNKEFAPIFDNPTDLRQISIPNFVTRRQPPMLLLWGRGDRTVFKDHLEVLESAIKKRGGKVQSKIYDETIDHVGILATLTQIRRDWAPVVNDVDSFLKSVK